MARRSLAKHLSGAEPSLVEVWDWYKFQDALIGDERVRVLDALLSGAVLDRPIYFGRPRGELIDFFENQQAELANAAMLGMLAAAEAALRVDYVVRVMVKGKDAISRDFAGLYKQHKLKVGLEEQILETWKRHVPPAIRLAIGRFNGALNLRHWLAHGRYWNPRLGEDYDPLDILEICRGLLDAIAER